MAASNKKSPRPTAPVVFDMTTQEWVSWFTRLSSAEEEAAAALDAWGMCSPARSRP